MRIAMTDVDLQGRRPGNSQSPSRSFLHLMLPQQVVVDPNRAAKHDSTLTPVLIEAFARTPSVGEEIVAIQDDHDGSFTEAFGAVVHVDEVHGLVHVRVNWGTMTESEVHQTWGTTGSNTSRPIGLQERWPQAREAQKTSGPRQLVTVAT